MPKVNCRAHLRFASSEQAENPAGTTLALKVIGRVETQLETKLRAFLTKALISSPPKEDGDDPMIDEPDRRCALGNSCTIAHCPVVVSAA